MLGYDLFDLDGATVTEVAFKLDGVTWHYRMAPTLDVQNNTGYLRLHRRSLTAEGKLRWCPPSSDGTRAAPAASSGVTSLPAWRTA